MFTGIIEETGRVVSFAEGPESWRLQVAAQLVPADVKLGDSVAVNGCCLTVTQFDAGHLWFDILAETRRLTNFAQLAPGSLVNLERSLRADARLAMRQILQERGALPAEAARPVPIQVVTPYNLPM